MPLALLTRRDPTFALPSPPTDQEKYWYMGRQHRWLLWAQSASFVLIGVSVLKFSLSDARLLLFLAPFSLFVVALLISLASSTRGKRVDRLDHELRVLEYAPARYPTVDVFLPSAGEPLEVLANTYQHVAALRWPAEVTVWVLDDSARDDVHQLAAEHGFAYRSRPDRGRLKKAGNLRYGYEQSDSDLIAIFDADFVPRPDYLSELVPYFDEPDVGIVQSPQFFDARRGMPWLQRCAGATQELFYRWIQPARDRSGAAICVGTCAVYRRAALQAAGGFAQIGHSEDVHTGVNLMKAGFGLRYIPILVSKGLCPDTVTAFVTQQYRWCTGSMSLLADKSFHEAAHIKGRQRVCFWAGFLYYITTAVNVLATPLPALAMIWLLPQYVYPHNSIYLLGALVLWSLVLPLVMKGHWRISVLRVQTLYSFAHLVAIVHVLRGSTREWVATGTAGGAPTTARRTPVATTVVRTMKIWVGLCQVLIWAGLLRDVHQYGLGRFWAMLAFAGLAAYVQWPLLSVRGRASRSAQGLPRRSPVRWTAELAWSTGEAMRRGRRAVGAAALTRVQRTRTGGPGPADAAAAVGSAADYQHSAPGLRAFRPDIQGLRAIAVSLVVLYHAHVPYLPGGYVGVDVFFVISGFLITGGLLRQVDRTGKVSFSGFYAGRFKRLAVPAALVLVVTVVGVRLWDSLFQVRPVMTDALWTALYGMNYRLALQGVDYQTAGASASPLQHYWSLAVEEQFYLAWPLLIMLCVWVFRRRHRHAVAAMAVVITGWSLYLCATLTHSSQPLAYFSIQSRAWELGVGALLALGATRLARLPRGLAAALSWIGVAGIVWSGLTYTDATLFPGTAALVPVLATAVVIGAGCRPSRRSAELLLDRHPMQGIGKVSYAWYLWHWPLLTVLPMLLGYPLGWPQQLEVAVLGLWLAVLTYYLLENPVLRSRLRRPVWLAVGPGLAGFGMLAAALLALSVPSLVGSGRAVTLTAVNTGAIQHAVSVGTLTVDAPSNLTPALADIRKDQPVSTLNGCHAGFLVVQQGACVYGDPAGTRTMVLFGDSHAQQWLPALDLEAKAQHWKLIAWTKAACPIAQVSVHAEQLGNRLFSECDDWRRITLGKIAGLHPDIVVVGQSDSVPGVQFSNSAWADATAKTLTDIRAVGTPVLFLLDTPVPSVNVPDCVASHLGNVDPCLFRRDSAYHFPGRHELVAKTLASVGITTQEPIDWLCTDRKCPAIVGNMLVYRDASHISTPYSAYLAPATAPLFLAKGP